MGSYRRDQFENPAIFVSGATQLLEGFPDCVIESVTSPRSGLQTECAWPPSHAEIKARCERSLRQYGAIYLNMVRQQKADERKKNPPKPATAEPKVDLIATHPYFTREAMERRQFDPYAVLKKLAAEVGRTLTDEEIAAMPDNDVGQWKKVKAS